MTRNWAPFRVDNSILVAPRPLEAPAHAGIGDRLRTAAFAEMQAELAFDWAADHYTDAPDELKRAWRHLAREERKHMTWLMNRMQELGLAFDERPVCDVLWRSLTECPGAKEFCHYMAFAEERGRRAGERFSERLAKIDSKTAEIFGQIAFEESAHIALAYRFFPLHEVCISP